MVLNVKAGTITLTTAGTTWDTTGLGFSDGKILLTFWNDLTATGMTDGYGWGVGAAKDSSNQFSGFAYSQDNVAAAVTNKSLKTSVIHSTGASDTVITDHTFSAWIPDGFRLSRASGAAANKVGYLVLGGTDITDWTVTTFDATTSSASQSVNLGYRPDMLFFVFMQATALSVTAHANMGMGFVGGKNIEQYCISNVSEDAGVDSDTWLNQRYIKSISILDGATGAQLVTGTANITDTGFDVTWSGTPAAAYKIVVVALKGVNFEVKLYTNPATGTPPFDKDIPTRFRPKALIQFDTTLSGTGGADFDTVFAAANAVNMGCGTSATDQFVFTSVDADAAPTMISSRTHQTNRLAIVHSTNATGSLSTITNEVSLKSFSDYLFTITHNVATATQYDFIFGVIGEKALQPHSYGKINTMFDNNTGATVFG